MLNELYQSLDPVAISAGPITIYWYGIAYIVGAIITGVVMYRTQRRWGLNLTIDDLVSVVVGVVFGLIIGARLFYVVFYGDGYYLAHRMPHLQDLGMDRCRPCGMRSSARSHARSLCELCER